MNSIAPWVADCKSSQYFLFVVWVPAFAPPPLPRLTPPRNLVYKRVPLIEPGFAIVFCDSMATTSGNSANFSTAASGQKLGFFISRKRDNNNMDSRECCWVEDRMKMKVCLQRETRRMKAHPWLGSCLCRMSW